MPTYNNDDECVWEVEIDENDQNIQANLSTIYYTFRELRLDYNSFFQLTCQKDNVRIYSRKSELSSSNSNSTDGSGLQLDHIYCVPRQPDKKISQLREGSAQMTVDLDYIYQVPADSSYVKFLFKADAQLVARGVYLEWWLGASNSNEVGYSTDSTADFNQANNPAGRPDSVNNTNNFCYVPNFETQSTLEKNLEDNSNKSNNNYGRVYDIYHLIYIVLIICLILKAITSQINKHYRNLKNKGKDGDEDSEEDSDDSDLDEDESDIYDQYDLDQDEDDVDDFSLLTLLEMKANRAELGQAVEKLTQEMNAIDEEDDENMLEDSSKRGSLAVLSNPNNEPTTGRRMSNINKIHGGLNK